uniref:Uncharacterized protein n=1 Tax=Manihot esculenta TaxID=3983 RepID=A0A199UCG9_MANES
MLRRVHGAMCFCVNGPLVKRGLREDALGLACWSCARAGWF